MSRRPGNRFASLSLACWLHHENETWELRLFVCGSRCAATSFGRLLGCSTDVGLCLMGATLTQIEDTVTTEALSRLWENVIPQADTIQFKLLNDLLNLGFRGSFVGGGPHANRSID